MPVGGDEGVGKEEEIRAGTPVSSVIMVPPKPWQTLMKSEG